MLRVFPLSDITDVDCVVLQNGRDVVIAIAAGLISTRAITALNAALRQLDDAPAEATHPSITTSGDLA